MNVEPTAEIINKMAAHMRDKADELDRIAARMKKTESFDGASDAISVVSNMMNNLRLDLLITRPLREYERDR